MPFAARSTRASVRPNVLSPGRLTVLVRVTLKPNGLVFVFPGLERVEVVKCEVAASSGFMHGAPLMKKPCLGFVSATQ